MNMYCLLLCMVNVFSNVMLYLIFLGVADWLLILTWLLYLLWELDMNHKVLTECTKITAWEKLNQFVGRRIFMYRFLLSLVYIFADVLLDLDLFEGKEEFLISTWFLYSTILPQPPSLNRP